VDRRRPGDEVDWDFDLCVLTGASASVFPARRMHPRHRLVVGLEEQFVVRNRLLDQLFQEKQLGTVDDRVDALLKRLHRRERLKIVAD